MNLMISTKSLLCNWLFCVLTVKAAFFRLDFTAESPFFAMRFRGENEFKSLIYLHLFVDDLTMNTMISIVIDVKH